MKKLLTLIGIAAALALAWYLLSPLFIDEVVEEDFPISADESANLESDDESGSIEISEASDEMAVSTADHQMTQVEIDAMTDAEKAAMEQVILEEMADEPDKMMNEDLPQAPDNSEAADSSEPVLLGSGQFTDADSFHKGSGEAKLFTLADGTNLLRFEDVEFTNGPDLRVYLASEANPTKEQVKNGVELAKLKGNVGSQNYELPADLNPKDYQSVVIYCKPFSVIFSSATLQ